MRYVDKGLALLLLVSGIAGAQDPPRGGGRGRRGGAPPDSLFARGGRMGPGKPQGQRGMPEGQREVRQAIERIIRTQVKPTDVQMRQLQTLDARFEPQRVKLVRDEMSLRQQLRTAMLDTANVDEAKIGQLLDQMITLPGKRAALMEAEQKELAGILSPLQRAKYQAIQEQLRRRIEQGRGGPPPNRPPGGGPPPNRPRG